MLAASLVMASCETEDPFTIITSESSILINGNINNLTIPGGIAGGAGAVPAFDVVVGNNATSVTVTNRYILPAPSTTVVEKTLGTYNVAGGKASIPQILISDLRLGSDPAITSAATVGTNTFLIDVALSSGQTQRRLFPLSLANTVIIVDSDIYKIGVGSSLSSGVPSFTITVNSTATDVRVTSRYVVPGASTAKNYTGGATTYPTVAVDGVTRTATIAAIAIDKLRDPADPAISDISNVGQQFILIEALSSTGTVLASKTINVTW